MYQIPSWLQRMYRGVMWRGDQSRKVVYLTFDDGPIPDVTPQLLDILKREQVSATFFMVGENATKYPHLLQRVVREGHRVGNHTYNHLKGYNYSTIEYMNNVVMADKVLNGTDLFRPPYGRITFKQKKALSAAGYKIVLWDVLTHDYDAHYSTDTMVSIIKKHVRNGSIINFHDSLKSNERMLAAIPQVIAYLRNEGYTFETL